ncbi:MAG: hypothetical protein AAF738_03390 [Bacteroidota bacterium]
MLYALVILAGCCWSCQKAAPSSSFHTNCQVFSSALETCIPSNISFEGMNIHRLSALSENEKLARQVISCIHAMDTTLFQKIWKFSDEITRMDNSNKTWQPRQYLELQPTYIEALNIHAEESGNIWLKTYSDIHRITGATAPTVITHFLENQQQLNYQQTCDRTIVWIHYCMFLYNHV